MLEYKGYVGTVAYEDVSEVRYARVTNRGPYCCRRGRGDRSSRG